MDSFIVYKMLPGCLFALSLTSTKMLNCEDGQPCKTHSFDYMVAVGGFLYEFTGL